MYSGLKSNFSLNSKHFRGVVFALGKFNKRLMRFGGGFLQHGEKTIKQSYVRIKHTDYF